MRVLYGVVGEGLGHATRSRVVIEHLAARGHAVRVVVSGKAHAFLSQRLPPGVQVEAIEGFSLAFEDAELDLLETILTNLELAPRRLRKNLEAYQRLVDAGARPDVVVSDYESWAYLFARNHHLPVISIDNMQMLNRCALPDDLAEGLDFRLARAAVKVKLPGAYHYLVTSFFYPPVRKPRTTLVPPILRREILDARREPADHVLVYQTASANQDLLPVLRGLPGRFVLFGAERRSSEGNVELHPFSETGFVDALRTARAVIATGGFSLMSEAVHLRVPMLAVPLAGQFEQELNCRYLARLRYGSWATALGRDVLERFLDRVPQHQEALAGYEPADNTVTLDCVDELLDHVAAGLSAPDRLQTVARGAWPG